MSTTLNDRPHPLLGGRAWTSVRVLTDLASAWLAIMVAAIA